MSICIDCGNQIDRAHPRVKLCISCKASHDRQNRIKYDSKRRIAQLSELERLTRINQSKSIRIRECLGIKSDGSYCSIMFRSQHRAHRLCPVCDRRNSRNPDGLRRSGASCGLTNTQEIIQD